jgi:hypothetical protein
VAGPEEKVYFFFLSGAKKGKIESAPATGLIRIGRQHDSTLQLDPYEDIPASGDHAQIVCEGHERFLLEDRGSSWGTFKNDVPVVGRVPITTGDVITCGQDDQGRQGPRLKFYLEKDVLRCPGCEGPVYKRHFKCPACKKKHCLRCIDFKAKTCKACGPQVVQAKAKARPAAKPTGTGDPGFEILEDDDDDEAARPARVVVSGRDARSFKRAQEKGKEKKKKAAGDPGIVAEPVDLDAPFCAVCCEFAEGPVFTCPACRQTVCVAHKKGVVCPPCAGVAAGAPDAVSRASEPELVVPDLDLPDEAPPPRPAPRATPQRPEKPRSGPAHGTLEDSGRRRAGSGSSLGGVARVGSGSGADRRGIPSTMRFTAGPPQPDDGVVLARPDPAAASAPPPALRAEPIKQPPPAPRAEPIKQPPPARPPSDASRPAGNVPTPPPGTGGADPLLTRSNIDARRPPAIPCERCAAPLSATSFFICERCRSRLCGQHRSATRPTSCDRCGAPPSPFDAPARAPLPYASAPPQQPTPLPPTPGLGRPAVGTPWTPPVPAAPLPPRRPSVPQDLIETAGDDVLPPLPPPGAPPARTSPPPMPLGLSGSGSGRNARPMSVSGSGVRFECPYCDEQLTPNTASCPKCGREL